LQYAGVGCDYLTPSFFEGVVAKSIADFNLDAYFRRIGYTGARSPTLETLRAVHRHHARAIPFENLNPLLGWPVRLDVTSLQEKIVRGGRGGYCFEHNLLLMHALRAIGFSAIGLAARVVYNAAVGVVPARSHMLLRIGLDGTAYVADVGFGGLTLTDPLQLEPDVEQSTSLEPFRLVAAGDEFLMQACIGGEWKSLYRFGLQEQQQVDYEVANWYVSTHPESRFVIGLIAARPDTDRRYALQNNELTVHHVDGRTEHQVLGSVAALRETLTGPLRIAVPDSPDLDATLDRLTRQSQ
jgi:N-hydroxyarylamine O-acetyltransferase